MTTELTDLEGDEVSHVPKGANRKQYYLTKADGSTVTMK